MVGVIRQFVGQSAPEGRTPPHGGEKYSVAHPSDEDLF